MSTDNAIGGASRSRAVREHARRVATIAFWYGVLTFLALTWFSLRRDRNTFEGLGADNVAFANLMTVPLAETLWGRASLLGVLRGTNAEDIVDDLAIVYWIPWNVLATACLVYGLLIVVHPPIRRTGGTRGPRDALYDVVFKLAITLVVVAIAIWGTVTRGTYTTIDGVRHALTTVLLVLLWSGDTIGRRILGACAVAAGMYVLGVGANSTRPFPVLVGGVVLFLGLVALCAPKVEARTS